MTQNQHTTTSPFRRLVRWALNLLYTRFAFAYDWVSAIVSRGEWRAWTRAAIPFVQGTHILEIAFGTGNLHLDLYDAGYAPIGIDRSPEMGELTRKKFRAGKHAVPLLARCVVQQLPFPDTSFSTLIMTFPPGFVYDMDAMRELWRVLEPRGVLLWVDSPLLKPVDAWSRFLRWLFVTMDGCASPDDDMVTKLLREEHGGALLNMWDWRVERVDLEYSSAHVFVGTKNEHSVGTSN